MPQATPWRTDRSRSDPGGFYDLLLNDLPTDARIAGFVSGMIWTLARVDNGLGIALSPERARPGAMWAEALQGRLAVDVAAWVRSWSALEASAGMAALNALLNARSPLVDSATPLYADDVASHPVFDHFRSRLRDKRVVVVGRTPGVAALRDVADVTVIDVHPGNDALPPSAAEYRLGDADWVFLSAASIIDKTFPRLAELSAAATTVLLGPTTPWLAALRDYDIDYLAGVTLRDDRALQRTVAEGGGSRIFDTGARYALVDLRQDETARLKSAISALFARRGALKAQMEAWYAQGHLRFPGNDELLHLDASLAVLDQRYKKLWDRARAAEHASAV